MSTAMRDPVLMDKNFVQSRAAIQKFIPKENPKDYERLANAQMRAAQAEGNVGLALAEAGIKFGDAALQVNTIHQTTAADTRHADLKAWVGQYSADLSGVQLSAWNEERGGYNYEFVEGDFEKAWKKKNEELDKQYKINNGLIRQDLGNKTKGIKTAMGMELAKFVRGAEDEASQHSSMKQYGLIANESDLQDWKKTAQLIFPPEKVYELENDARSAITFKAFDGRISSVEGASNDQLDLMQEELDALLRPTPGGAPKIQSDEYANVVKLISHQKLVNKAEVYGKLDSARTEADVRAAYEEGVYRLGSSDLMASEQVNLESSFLAKLSSVKVNDAVSSMYDESGQLIGDAGNYSMLADSVKNDPEISPKHKQEFDAMLLGNVAEMHVLAITNAFNADPTSVAGLADKYKEGVLLTDSRELGLGSDNLTGVSEVYVKLDQYLTTLKDGYVDTVEVLDADAKKRRAVSNYNRNKGSIAKSDRVAYADYAWQDYSSLHAAPGVDLKTLLNKFVSSYGAVPPSIVDSLVESVRVGNPMEKAEAYTGIAQLNEASGGRLEFQSDANTQTVRDAISLQSRLDSVSPNDTKARGEIIENYVARMGDSSNDTSAADLLWKNLSSQGSEELEGAVQNYLSSNNMPEEMDALSRSMFEMYLKDAVYKYQNTTAAVRSAMGTIRDKMGIENGKLVYNSIYAVHEFGTGDDQWHDGRNPVKATVEEIARRSNMDEEDIAFYYDERNEWFAAFNKATGEYITVLENKVDENGEEVLDQYGHPIPLETRVIFSRYDLSEEGEHQLDVSTASEEETVAVQEDKKAGETLTDARFMPNEFGQFSYGVNSRAMDTKTDQQMKHEEALRAAADSDDPYVAGEAEIEIQVLNSVEYNDPSMTEEAKAEMMDMYKGVRRRRIEAEERLRKELIEQSMMEDVTSGDPNEPKTSVEDSKEWMRKLRQEMRDRKNQE